MSSYAFNAPFRAQRLCVPLRAIKIAEKIHDAGPTCVKVVDGEFALAHRSTVVAIAPTSGGLRAMLCQIKEDP